MRGREPETIRKAPVTGKPKMLPKNELLNTYWNTLE